MPEREYELFDPKYFSDLTAELSRSENPADQYLLQYLEPGDTLRKRASPPPLVVVGEVVRDAKVKEPHAEPEDPSHALARSAYLGRQFLAELLKELRKLLCGNKAEHLTNASLSALIAHLAVHFGLPILTTTGIVFLLLSAIARALRKSFCKTVDSELINAISRNKSK